MKRPMLYWVSLFVLGEILSSLFPIERIGYEWMGMAVGGAAIFMIFDYVFLQRLRLCRERTLKDIFFFTGCIFMLLGMLRMYQVRKEHQGVSLLQGKRVTFVGKICEREETQFGYYYILKVTLCDEADENCVLWRGKARLCAGVDLYDFPVGSQLQGNARVSPFSQATNPGGYDEEIYYKGKGVFTGLELEELTTGKIPAFSIQRYLQEFKTGKESLYYRLLEERDASIACAMVLGEKKDIDPEIKELYRKSGIAHLIAISGLHIALLGGTLYHILRKLLGGYLCPAMAGGLMIGMYGCLTGLSGATLRAIIMLVMSIFADVVGRQYDSVSAVAVALLWMLFENPYQLYQAGFLLSYGAVLAIAVIAPLWKQLLHRVPKLLETFFVSVSIQLVTTPIQLYYFYEIPLYGVFFNVLVIPLMSVLLPLLVGSGILGNWWFVGAKYLAYMAGWILRFYELLCNGYKMLPWNHICTGRPDMWWMIGYYALLVVFVFWGYRMNQEKKKQKSHILFGGTLRGITIWVFCLIGYMSLLWRTGDFTVTFLDVGQGDGIYMQTPKRHHILVDGGSSTRKAVGSYVIEQALLYHGADIVDYVFVTHSDSDHYSGILELLQEENISIQNFVLPFCEKPDDAYRQLMEEAKKKGCKIYCMKKGEQLFVDGVMFTCISPKKKFYTDKNAGSLVLTVQYENFDILLTGDMTQETEEELREEGLLYPVEVLKVAHHGSDTSTSQSFLDVVTPNIACISVGEGNSYGHPSKEVVKRLERMNSRMYLTKRDGAITIKADGSHYQIMTYKRSGYEDN